ncbi:MAG TPA: gluconokinase [Verrucomicrobiales bacterium]|nr:gluconokinase [Verrucomicrobiales bacterium]
MGDVVVIMGVSGSGKTVLGLALGAATSGAFFDGDDFHSAENVEKMRSGQALTDEDRRQWLERLRELIADRRDVPGWSFLACSALRRSYRDILRRGDPALRFLFLDAPEDVLRERMEARRDHYMPAGLLRSQLDTLERPSEEEAARLDAAASKDALLEEALIVLKLPVHGKETGD